MSTPSNLIQLIYGSSAPTDMTEQDLLAILKKSRDNNRARNITGLLLFKSGNFLQVLEGEEDAVMDLYRTIQKDSRHSNIITVANRKIKERDFGDWQMAFVNLNSVNPADVPGYSEFLNDPFDGKTFAQKPSRAFAFINVFKAQIR